MATSGEQDQRSELSCSICFEQYRLPKILQCSHVYCHLCLRSLASDKDSGFGCPICRQTVHVTLEGIDALPTYPCQEMSREEMIPASSSARPDPCAGGVKQNLNFASENPAQESACDESFAINSCMKRKPFPESPPENINFTKNSRTLLQSLTLTADNKLWVKYLPPGNIHPFLSIYDCQSKLIGRWMENSVEGTDLVCLGDCLLSPRTWRWISPDGKSGSLGYPPNSWVLCSKSLPPHVVLHRSVSDSKKEVFFVCPVFALEVHGPNDSHHVSDHYRRTDFSL